MSKYIDAEKLKSVIKAQINERKKWMKDADKSDRQNQLWSDLNGEDMSIIQIINSLQKEQPIPDSSQLIAEWEKEKAVLEQKDFRGDAERMAYNAFLDGFVKGIGYGRTK